MRRPGRKALKGHRDSSSTRHHPPRRHPSLPSLLSSPRPGPSRSPRHRAPLRSTRWRRAPCPPLSRPRRVVPLLPKGLALSRGQANPLSRREDQHEVLRRQAEFLYRDGTLGPAASNADRWRSRADRVGRPDDGARGAVWAGRGLSTDGAHGRRRRRRAVDGAAHAAAAARAEAIWTLAELARGGDGEGGAVGQGRGGLGSGRVRSGRLRSIRDASLFFPPSPPLAGCARPRASAAVPSSRV